MSEGAESGGAIRFGVYEVDTEAGELRKNGVKLKLQEQPFQVLVVLLRRHGQIVTREELREQVWPGHTFVDFDQGLNTAIAKIREALGDSASNPRFVETVPRRGYRFIAPVKLPAAVREEASGDGATVAATPWWRHPASLIFLLGGLALGLLLNLSLRRSDPEPEPVRRFTIAPEEYVWEAAISPDGVRIAYAAGFERRKLWIHELATGTAREVAGTEGAVQPFWSPDGQHVAFADKDEMLLKRLEVAGGALATICEVEGPSLLYFSGVWPEGGEKIVYSQEWAPSIYEVAARGGEPVEILGRQSQFLGCSAPRFPFGVQDPRMLCQTFDTRAADTIVLRDLDSEEHKVLTTGRMPLPTPNGYLLFESGSPSNIEAVRLSFDKLSTAGESFPVARNAHSASLAADGTLVYVGDSIVMHQLAWADRTGKRLGGIGQPQFNMSMPSLSPDGRFVAVSAAPGEESNRDIWIHDVERAVATRLTRHRFLDHRPIWLPSGRELVYSTNRLGNDRDVYLIQSDGSGEPVPVIEGPGAQQPAGWSRRGEYLVYQDFTAEMKNDLYFIRRQADGRFGDAARFLATPANERMGEVSPDARWIAYCSTESGPDEVYVERFSEGGDRIQISRNGGTQPRWSADGKELFYVEGETLMSVQVKTGGGFTASAPEALFAHSGLWNFSPEQQYDVAADGERFVVKETFVPEGAKPLIHVVQNWDSELRDQESN